MKLMKKIFTTLLGLGFLCVNSQELRQEDGLRYAIQDLTGTARYRAMSGAFGALGGDLSALNVNPAGSIFFSNNYASVTGSSFNTKNNSNYFETKTRESNNNLDLNQIGAVFIFEDNSENSDWKKFSIGLNYENTRDFSNEVFIAGTNSNNSISGYFVDQANFIANTDFNDYQYDMGYETYIINEDTNNPGTFISNVPSGGNYYQENFIATTGYNGKITGNFATSYKDKIFLGLNLNAHFTDYVRTTRLYESNNNPENPSSQPTVREIAFDNQVSTYGSGFSFNVGAIAKVTESFRIGIAYESPTWYKLNDELVQDLYTFNNINVPSGSENRYYEGPIFVFPTYKLQTPSTLTGSAAYIFGNRGLISLDVSRKDFSQIQFKPKNEDVYYDLNTGIGNSLTDALEIRLGGEYKYKQWSFRGGYRFEESPYNVDYAMGDLTGYSGGLGYNFGKNKLDLAYSYAHRNYNQYLISSGMNDTARIRTIQNNVTLTYSVNF